MTFRNAHPVFHSDFTKEIGNETTVGCSFGTLEGINLGLRCGVIPLKKRRQYYQINYSFLKSSIWKLEGDVLMITSGNNASKNECPLRCR